MLIGGYTHDLIPKAIFGPDGYWSRVVLYKKRSVVGPVSTAHADLN